MKNVAIAVFSGAILLSVVSCSLIDKFTSGGQEMIKVGELWSDVPRMDGLNPSEAEMPIGIKLVLRTIIGNLGRMNKEGEPQTTGDIDWTAFSGSKTPSEIQSFYSNDRMATAGNWKTGKDSSCVDGKDSGVDGVLCVFQKEVDKRQVGLVILAIQDEKSKQSSVYYLRLEADKPAANK